MEERSEKTIIRKDLDYHHALMEGLWFTFKEAAEDGLLQEYEDLIDVIYATIPTKKKEKIMVYDDGLKKEITSIEAWNEAKKIKPPKYREDGTKALESDEGRAWVHRERALRKTQICTDIQHALGFLMTEPPTGRMRISKRETND